MTDTKNSQLAIELPAYVVDILADWARADAKAMHPANEQSEKKQAREARRELGDTFARAVQQVMPSLSAEGDLADAFNERAEAYEAHRKADRVGRRIEKGGEALVMHVEQSRDCSPAKT